MKSKHLLLGSILLSGAFMSPQIWSEEVVNTGGFDGFVSGGVGQGQNSNVSNANGHGRVDQLRVSVAYTGKDGFGGQLDNVYERQQKLPSDIISGASTTDMAGHLFYRNATWLSGVFAQRRTFDIKSNNLYYGGSLHAPIDRTFYGVEGQYYLKDLTLYGQVGRQELGLVPGYSPTGNLINTEARYFVNDNWKATAGYGYNKLNGRNDINALGFDGKTNTYSLGTEYRFQNTPLSIFAQYDSLHQSYSSTAGSFNSKSNVFLAGVRMNLGKETLRQRDKDGATLNPVPVDNSILSSVLNAVLSPD
jgi:hypothetical protein